MALEVVWMLTALVILATICIGVFKGLLGDILQFRRGPRDFVLDRLARYGDPFTISLMGKTYTVVSSPEAVKFVLSTAHASFRDALPVQIYRLLGRAEFEGERHAHIRKILLSAASGDGLQKQVPFINSFAEKTVKSWENQAVVDSVEESQKFTFNVGMRILWRNVQPGSEEMEQIRNEASRIEEGVAVLPINFPGFRFHKALKAKEVLISRIQKEISRRRKAGIQEDDVLNAFMSIREVEVPDYDVCCLTVGTMFSVSETTSATIAWVLKYLDNFPDVRQRVQDEQDGLRQKMTEDKSLTWFKPKISMPYTLQVIYEVLRMETFLTFPRQVNKDIDYNGLFFRKDSYVMASATSLHYDPKYYPNPREFDPSRFVKKPNPIAFLPFGQGRQHCPGSEMALTEIMLIIHHLVTNYSFERCGLDEGVKQFVTPKPTTFWIRLVKKYT